MLRKFWFLFFIPALLPAQETSDLERILERLDRLEQENRNLAAEVHALRDELAASRTTPQTPQAANPPTATTPAETPPLDERVAVEEARVNELAQTKVEAAQKFPIKLTGTLLFNSFLNDGANGGQEYPITAALTPANTAGSATFSQTILGLTFQGPHIFGGGEVNGSIYMDLWGGSSSSLDHLMRLRVATVEMDWKNQTLSFGQDKPIISPREPTSLAQVAYSPLAGAGNLWLWQPQARFEQRFSLGSEAGIRADGGVYESNQPAPSSPTQYSSSFSTLRPAAEERVEFWRKFGDDKRIEIASGFHFSQFHYAGVSLPSNLYTIDWLIQPVRKIQFTGMFFHGQNAAGLGGLGQGFTIFANGLILPVGAAGGWSQLSFLATSRLSFNAYGGEEDDRAADLLAGAIHRNFLYAGNVMYHLGPNVILALEASQTRTSYFGSLYPSLMRVNNHYDLALGYLF